MRIGDRFIFKERDIRKKNNSEAKGSRVLFAQHGSGGRRVEFYNLNQLLESVGLNPGVRRKACQP
jgi:hypothetical protein